MQAHVRTRRTLSLSISGQFFHRLITIRGRDLGDVNALSTKATGHLDTEDLGGQIPGQHDGEQRGDCERVS